MSLDKQGFHQLLYKAVIYCHRTSITEASDEYPPLYIAFYLSQGWKGHCCKVPAPSVVIQCGESLVKSHTKRPYLSPLTPIRDLAILQHGSVSEFGCATSKAAYSKRRHQPPNTNIIQH
jgi:hypothetical protein